MTKVGDAALTVSRVNQPIGSPEMSAPAQDAFGLIFQLAPLPAHDFWTDGKHRRISAGPAATLSIIDLGGGASSEVPEPFDSLGLCIPRAALDAFTAEASISHRRARSARDVGDAQRDHRPPRRAARVCDGR